MWWVLLNIACIDYNIESSKDLDLGMDTAVLDDESDANTDDDTGFEEDTAEPDIVEDPEIADAKIYANTSGALYEVNPENGESTWIGEFGDMYGKVDHFEDIAIDLTGHMYGGAPRNGDREDHWLYLINPTTAAVQPVCPLYDIPTTALTFTSDGSLVIGVDSSLYIMDIETCDLETLIVSSYFGYETSGDIVGLPDGFLYWSVRGGDEDQLIRVNPRTGYETWVGYINENRLYGMGYANDELFGFSGSGNIVGINPDSADSYFLKGFEDISWWGATTNPVVWE